MISRHRILATRDRIIKAIRSFLAEQGFLEVQTPLMIKAPVPEASIEVFPVFQGKSKPDLYLIPSPEINLKRLLAEGLDRIFQLGPVFRQKEQGRHHLPEFTMLEWYRAGADYHDLMSDCEAIIKITARAAGWKDDFVTYKGRKITINPKFPRITIKKAFEKYAGWIPGPSPDLDRFNEDMATKIEPNLPPDRPVFLIDYPASCASLARLKPSDPKVAERVELYAGGLEIANGFSELTDHKEQEARFRKEAKRREEQGLNVYPWPEEFLSSLSRLPKCAGMALGIDRLIMLLTDTSNINDVVAFPPEKT
ncbi:MAG: EF-P lysine aminoacylase GenX [Deltaproteobacteria bacterium]|nr:EF-P lysine aminoacylase GenX [Deltaproteobacteria bacterium]